MRHLRTVTKKPWFWRRCHTLLAIFFSMFVVTYALIFVHDATISVAAMQLGMALFGAAVGIYHLGHPKADEQDSK